MTRLEIIFTITVAIIGFTWPGALWIGSVIWERKKRAKRIKEEAEEALRKEL